MYKFVKLLENEFPDIVKVDPKISDELFNIVMECVKGTPIVKAQDIQDEIVDVCLNNIFKDRHDRECKINIALIYYANNYITIVGYMMIKTYGNFDLKLSTQMIHTICKYLDKPTLKVFIDTFRTKKVRLTLLPNELIAEIVKYMDKLTLLEFLMNYQIPDKVFQQSFYSYQDVINVNIVKHINQSFGYNWMQLYLIYMNYFNLINSVEFVESSIYLRYINYRINPSLYQKILDIEVKVCMFDEKRTNFQFYTQFYGEYPTLEYDFYTDPLNNMYDLIDYFTTGRYETQQVNVQKIFDLLLELKVDPNMMCNIIRHLFKISNNKNSRHLIKLLYNNGIDTILGFRYINDYDLFIWFFGETDSLDEGIPCKQVLITNQLFYNLIKNNKNNKDQVIKYLEQHDTNFNNFKVILYS